MTRWLAHASFWLATLVIVIMGWTLYEASTNEAESARRVSHSQNVRQRLVAIEALIERTESAQRGYLLSVVEVFPVERNDAYAKLEKSIAGVRPLTLETPTQQQRLDELAASIRARHASMSTEERTRRAGQMDAAQINAAAGVGYEARKQMLGLTKTMRMEEYSSLRGHRAAATHRHETELGVLIAAAAFGLIVLIPGYLGFVLQSRSRVQTEVRLQLMADSLPGAIYQLRHTPRGQPRMLFLSAAIQRVSTHVLPNWAALLDEIDERDRPAFLLNLAACKLSLAPFRHSYRVRHTGGATQYLHHEASLQRQSDGGILQTGYITDVSEQRRLEQDLVAARDAADQANRAKSAFLATMSHEIRTPMNGALGMLELLSLTQLDFEQRTTLTIVRESSKSLLRLIDDILDFSMMEADKLEIRPEVVSIHDVIEGVRDIYSGVASSKGLSIRRSTDPKISPAVRVDPLRLRQILNNLVSNALKFTSNGHVEIKADWVARANDVEQVRFTVADTGIGISAEDQARLFQPFSQGEAQARQAGGTGLGLTISRRLAGLMGGTVDMTSALGAGTTMIVNLSLPIADPALLPRVDVERAHAGLITLMRSRRQAPSAELALQEGTLVLIVDDHPTNRMLLMRQVHTLGYAAESAENGNEALARWQSHRYALLITDCNMPEMDGYELTKAIRASESAAGAARVPIIACTANALGGQAEQCLAVGMDDCLVKPVDLTQLARKLDQWLPLPVHLPAPGPAEPAVAPPSSSTDQVCGSLDRSVLAEISGGDVLVERSILGAFRLAAEEDMQTLGCAVVDRDLGQVTRSAHRISGACRMIGASALAQACALVEHAARAGDWEAIAADIVTLNAQWKCLHTCLDDSERSSKETPCPAQICDS